MEAASGSGPVLAPVASIEDLSDGESPPGRMGDRLAAPGPSVAKGGVAPPRIDISRASSSSHHDDSSPERELFAGGEGSGGVKLGLGFTEEMALELRSSTEELDYHGPPEVSETRHRRRKLTQQHAVPKYELEAQSEKERKDSACSDIGLLSISGRTSRLSSIGSGGSAASGVSGASHVSGGSHLSAVSQLSKTSRCSSPHRTLLETSFCGPKPIPTLSLETEYPPTESVEAALLARKTDPTGAVLPSLEEVGKIMNGIQTIQKAQQLSQQQETAQPKPVVQKQHQPPPKVVLHQTTIDLEAETQTKPPKPKPKHKRRPRPKLDNELSRIIPLHSEDSMETEDDAAEVEEPELEQSNGDRPYTPENGIYIPLKGPDPVLPPKKQEVERPVRRTESDRVRKLEPERTRKKEERSRKESKSERAKSKSARSPVNPQPTRPPRELDESELFKIIPLHGDTPPRQGSFETEEVSATRFVPWNEGNSIPSPQSTLSGRRSADQDLSRTKPATLDLARLEVAKPGSGTLDLGRTSKSTTSMRDESRTPSPAASLGRGSLFRRSSESSGSTKSRTSNSADSKTRKDSKNKSVFTTLFKKGGSGKERESTRRKSAESERHVSLDPKITNVEFTFGQDKKQQNAGPDAIVIPLHSPDSIAEPLMIYDPVSGKMISTRPEEEVAEMQKQYQPKTEKKEIVEKVVKERKVDVLQQPPKEPRSKSAPPLAAAAQGEVVVVERRAVKKEQPPSPPKRRFKEGGGTTDKESAGKRDSAVSKTPSSADDSSSMTHTWSAADGTIIVAADVITHSVPEERPDEDEEGPADPPLPPRQVTPEELLPELLKLLPADTASETPDDALQQQQQQQQQLKPKAPQLAAASDERKSSESEPDSDALPLPHENGAECGDDQEKKGLVHQPESIEDELPYVPTTLPQERSLAHPMIPIKQRVSEVKTFPIERPRSTTPINPSTLETYITPHEDNSACQWDKMQITLPRPAKLGSHRISGSQNSGLHNIHMTDSIKSESRSRSPSGKPRTWTHFVEQGMPHRGSTPPTPPPSPPPLPPRATAAWVSFEEVPERRRAPKRITTLPSSAPASGHAHAHTVLSYVNPEECSCECHDSGPPSSRNDGGGGRCQDVTHTTSSKSASCSVTTPRHRPDLPGVETLRRDKSKTRNYRT